MATLNHTESATSLHSIACEPATVPELCDQCVALATVISESHNHQIRDCLHWTLLDMLHRLRKEIDDE